MQFLKNRVTGVLFPYNPDHANREYFETVELPWPAPANEDDWQDNGQQFYDAKPKRQYRKKVKTNDDSGTPSISPTEG